MGPFIGRARRRRCQCQGTNAHQLTHPFLLRPPAPPCPPKRPAPSHVSCFFVRDAVSLSSKELERRAPARAMAPKPPPDGTCGLTCRALCVPWYGVDVTTNEHVECEWVQNTVTKSLPRMTQYGKTGLVRLRRRSGGEPVPDCTVKVHCCKHSPCGADWPATQFGFVSPPSMHLRPTDFRPLGAAAPQPAPQPAAPMPGAAAPPMPAPEEAPPPEPQPEEAPPPPPEEADPAPAQAPAPPTPEGAAPGPPAPEPAEAEEPEEEAEDEAEEPPSSPSSSSSPCSSWAVLALPWAVLGLC